MFRNLRSIPLFLAVFLALSGTAGAQWVLLGKKAVGKVKKMTGQAPAGETKDGQKPGYATATVLVDAPADKVYAAAVRVLKANPAMTVTKQDEQALSLEFTDGQLAAGIQVTGMAEDLTQLLVVSTTNGKTDAALVVGAVQRVCKELGVTCQVPEE